MKGRNLAIQPEAQIKTEIILHNKKFHVESLWSLHVFFSFLFLQILEAVSLIEESMEKLQLYGKELVDICEKHFPDIKRRIPKIKRRHPNNTEKLKSASQK